MDARLKNILEGLPPVAVAFSGGLDSRFLLASCLEAGHDVMAVHVTGPHIPATETAGARDFAATMGIRLIEVTVDPLSVPEVARTDRMRCYHCKKVLMGAIKRVLKDAGESHRLLCDGSNFDDQDKYRPGIRALREENVFSPLAQSGLVKKEIIRQAAAMGFPLPAERARPCLLTRYDYGLMVSLEELRRLEQAEAAIMTFAGDASACPLVDFRLRLTPAPMLQALEWREEWLPTITAIMEQHGFTPFTVVRTQTISGWFDRKDAVQRM